MCIRDSLGTALGLATTALFKFFPAPLEYSLSTWVNINGKWLVVLILLISAFFSLPASRIAMRYGLQTAFRYSLALVVVSVLGIVLFPLAMPMQALFFALL